MKIRLPPSDGRLPPCEVRTIRAHARHETADKTPRGLPCGPDRRTDVNFFESVSDNRPFDFRSPRFCTDASTLVRTTGRSLADCRQNLFIAEGDMVLAFKWLVSGYDEPTGDPVFH